MANSGTIRLIKKSANEYYEFEWKIDSSSRETNKSIIKWTLIYRNYTGSIHIKQNVNLLIGDAHPYLGELSAGISQGEEVLSSTTTLLHNLYGERVVTISLTETSTLTSAKKTDSATFTLDAIPREAMILNAPNFNDEENPTITYSNPAGDDVTALQACISFTGSEDDIPYRDIDKNGSSYTFELTEAERVTLRKWVNDSNSKAVRFYVKTIIKETTYWNYITKTATIINAEPVLVPDAIDINARTIELTGMSDIFIRGYSDVQFTSGAAARKESTIVSQAMVCGSQRFENMSSGVLDILDGNELRFSATDSRGNTTTATYPITVIPYFKPSIINFHGNLDANGTLNIEIGGKYFDGYFGAASNFLEFEYYLEENGSAMTDGWTIFAPEDYSSDGNGSFIAKYSIPNLNYQATYTIQVNIIDQLVNAMSIPRTIVAKPVYYWNKNEFNFNVSVGLEQDATVFETVDGERNREILGVYGDNHVLAIGDKAGATHIYGAPVSINGREYGAGHILWAGAYWMNDEQTIYLSRNISEQPNGVILVFSLYRNGAAENVSINTFFVHKKVVEILEGAPHTFIMGINSGFSSIGAKYLYISDGSIEGHATNEQYGQNSGISYSNDDYVLRYVIGV